MAVIKSIQAREILDSRGFPTVETKVTLRNGMTATASVPSGASVGKHEALELRDGDSSRYGGQGVLKAVENVNTIIAPALIGKEARNQLLADNIITKLDGTANKSRLGANAILSVSQGVCEAAALSERVANYSHVAHLFGLVKKQIKMPQVEFNLINGGLHGSKNLDFQEFLVLPIASSYRQALQTAQEIYQKLKQILIEKGKNYSIGDEGGFTPDLPNNLDAVEILIQAVEATEKKPKKDVLLGLDAAAGSFFREGKYYLKDRTMPMSTDELINFYQEAVDQFPIQMIEDPLNEDDFDGWRELSERLPATTLVGDDLLATNPKRVKIAVKKKSCQAIIIKPNQIGTISEAIRVIKLARLANWKIIVSHRSGETNDDFIADFAVGVGADYVKFGAPARGERIIKYNRLLEIEQEINKT